MTEHMIWNNKEMLKFSTILIKKSIKFKILQSEVTKSLPPC